jgi:hypothetical protein
MARQMFTTRAYASEDYMNQGLGIFIDGPRFMHGGDDAGFTAIALGYSSGQGVVIMCNGDGALGLLDDIARAIAAEPLAGLRPIGTGLQRDGAASAERRGPAQLSP